MIEKVLFRNRNPFRRMFTRAPRLIAVFSFRYDAHLVPDLVENLRPIVDGYAGHDDRSSPQAISPEPERREALVRAAREMRADWILVVDPDERLEMRAAERLSELTRNKDPIAWGFRLRELYTPDAYRIDGIWGKKVAFRLFPVLEGQEFAQAEHHGLKHPIGYPQRMSDLNLYHLKMIASGRRVARRDLYNRLDPHRTLQPIGYDYLADETGLVVEPIPRDRRYTPVHRDDGALWMPDSHLS